MPITAATVRPVGVNIAAQLRKGLNSQSGRAVSVLSALNVDLIPLSMELINIPKK